MHGVYCQKYSDTVKDKVINSSDKFYNNVVFFIYLILWLSELH